MAAITLLLTGRIGNGKSSTGNSILGKRVFQPRSSSASGSSEILKESTNRLGETVTVVDGLDIDDMGRNIEEGVDSLLKCAKKAFEKCDENVTAFVVVLKYGVRFTKQEKEAVDLIRSIFGQNGLKSNGVIVMSHGDNFDLDMEDESRTFKDWCANQTGDVEALFKECESRIVLFDNKAKDSETQQKQFENLMEMVSEIKNQPYTIANFQDAEIAQSKLLVKSKLNRLRQESEGVIDGIYNRLLQSSTIQSLKDLLQEVERHREELEVEDQGTSLLRELYVPLDTLNNTLRSRIRQTPQPPARREPGAGNITAITLLLTGRTGNGKSSTGNSILGKKVFLPRSSSASESSEILKESTNRLGKTVTVVDGLDIDDLGSNPESEGTSLSDRAQAAFEMCDENVKAFVLVLKYGTRFTKQEKEAVDLIRSIFGQNVLKSNGVIVMSHGDNFEMADEGSSFQDWHGRQIGHVKALIEECGSRIVLFNNKAKDSETQLEQFEQFMEKVNELNQPYTVKNFQDAKEAQGKPFWKRQLSELRQRAGIMAHRIFQRLGLAQETIDRIQTIFIFLYLHRKLCICCALFPPLLACVLYRNRRYIFQKLTHFPQRVVHGYVQFFREKLGR